MRRSSTIAIAATLLAACGDTEIPDDRSASSPTPAAVPETAFGASSDEPLPPERVFFADAYATDADTIEFGIQMLPGYYIYKDKISITVDGRAIDGLQLPTGVSKVDEWFGEQEVYFDKVFGSGALQSEVDSGGNVTIELAFQGCQDEGICYLPIVRTFTASLPDR